VQGSRAAPSADRSLNLDAQHGDGLMRVRAQFVPALVRWSQATFQR